MKRLTKLLLLLTLVSVPLCAQTTVNVTVTDTPDSQTWNNGTWTVIWVPAGQPTQQGQIISGGGSLNPQSGTLSGTGTASVSLPANVNIVPAQSIWQFTVCPQTTSGCFNQTVVVGISSPQTLNINPPSPRVGAGANTQAYNVNEVSGGIGSTYFDINSGSLRACSAGTKTTCSTWSSIAGTGTVNGPVSSVIGDIPLFNNLTGTLLSDSGVSVGSLGFVNGPSSSTNDDLTLFNGATGKLIKDSSIPVTNITQAPPVTNAVQYVSATGNDANTGTAADNAHAKATLSSSYAALPSTGGVIVVSGRLTSVAALSFATAQKPVMIECTKGAGLAFSATTGTQITFDWGGESSPALQTVAGGIQGCALTGAGGTSAAIELGGTNGGADGARIQDNSISGFQTGIQLTTGTVGPFNIVLDHNYFNGETTDVSLGGPGCENVNILSGVLGNATTGLSVTAGCGVRIAGTEFDANTGWAINVNAANNIHVHGIGVHFENPGGATAHYITAAGGQNQSLDFEGSSFSNDTTSASPLDHMISLTGTTASTNLSIKDSNIGTCNQNVTSFIDAADNNDVIYLVNTPVTCGTVSQLYPATGPNAITLLPSALTLHPPGFSRSAQYTIDGTGNAQIINGSHGLSFDLTPLTIDQTLKMPNASGLATLESGGTTLFNLFDVSSLTANRSTVIPDANTVLPQPLGATQNTYVTGLSGTTGALSTAIVGLTPVKKTATYTAVDTDRGSEFNFVISSAATFTASAATNNWYVPAVINDPTSTATLTIAVPSGTLTNWGNCTVSTNQIALAAGFRVALATDNTNWYAICSVAGGGVVTNDVDLTGQTASIASTTIITPSTNGFFRISCYTVITTAATTSSSLPSCAVTFTDADSSTVESQKTIASGSASNTVGTMEDGTFVLFAKSGTAIQYSTPGYASSGATAMVYAVHIRLEGPIQ